jgi:hypothetical protein
MGAVFFGGIRGRRSWRWSSRGKEIPGRECLETQLAVSLDALKS